MPARQMKGTARRVVEVEEEEKEGDAVTSDVHSCSPTEWYGLTWWRSWKGCIHGFAVALDGPSVHQASARAPHGNVNVSRRTTVGRQKEGKDSIPRRRPRLIAPLGWRAVTASTNPPHQLRVYGAPPPNVGSRWSGELCVCRLSWVRGCWCVWARAPRVEVNGVVACAVVCGWSGAWRWRAASRCAPVTRVTVSLDHSSTTSGSARHGEARRSHHHEKNSKNKVSEPY